MVKYRKHQIIASIWIAIFIVSFSLCLTVLNRSVYRHNIETAGEDFYKDYMKFKTTTMQVGDKINYDITIYEMEMDYKYLAEDFSSFFKIKYDSMDYKLKADNIERLNDLKGYYRMSWLMVILSCVGMLYSFGVLRGGRYYSPLIYGSLLSLLMTGINCYRFFNSGKETISALRDMVLSDDYSFFVGGDMLSVLIPMGFARDLAYTYLFFVFALIFIMVLIRLFTMYRGKPHKF